MPPAYERPDPEPPAPWAPSPETVVHLFPGQGDFAVSPLIRAARTHAVVRAAATEVFAQIDEVSDAYGVPALGPALLGDTPPSGRELAAGPLGTTQVALFGASMAIHRALCAIGAAPRRIVAVSFGEIAALTAAGVFGLRDGTHIACRLSRFLSRCRGGMTMLAAGAGEAERLVAAAGVSRVAVACVNDPAETVLSGPVQELDQVEERAADLGVTAVRLRLPFSSHHPSLTEQAEGFAAAIRTLPAQPAHTPVHSAVHGGPYGRGDDVYAGLAACLTHPARLPGVLGRAAAPGPALLLESGTGQALTRSAQRVLARHGSAVLARSPLAEPDFPWERPDRLHRPGAPEEEPRPAHRPAHREPQGESA
ncbi:acyltransferase domain-containing protein [Streptomyces oryzae]|uniref:Acyltransferase domain-containing protein n=1 Tax=Streptomyces oryzae TaxID=1434886 RepID=A0ABS3XA12_9ACTN|nr:acyltransferase domain-containing protein [Streptomyces oryzae]MBO8192203.1 acyltransferase domain-containing protein [Streptomyces oryzae]